jgi:dCMP deaminase
MERITRTPQEWDDFFMLLAVSVSNMSKDPNRKVGAVLVAPNKRYLSFGFNGFPSHIPDTKANLENKPFKLANMVHAEVNCLKQTASPIFNGTMYVTRFPCYKCAAEILQSGAVSRLVAPEPDFEHPTWGGLWREALWLFNHNNLEVTMRPNHA